MMKSLILRIKLMMMPSWTFAGPAGPVQLGRVQFWNKTWHFHKVPPSSLFTCSCCWWQFGRSLGGIVEVSETTQVSNSTLSSKDKLASFFFRLELVNSHRKYRISVDRRFTPHWRWSSSAHGSLSGWSRLRRVERCQQGITSWQIVLKSRIWRLYDQDGTRCNHRSLHCQSWVWWKGKTKGE